MDVTQAWTLLSQTDPTVVLLLIVLGFGMGLLSGMLGVGGGLLLIPALLYLPGPLGVPFSVPVKIATGYAVTQSVTGGFASSLTHLRSGLMLVPLVVYLGCCSMVGSYIGAWGSAFLSDTAILIIYLTSMGFTLWMFLFPPCPTDGENSPVAMSARDYVRRAYQGKFGLLFTGLTLLGGSIAGILGIGGSVFMVPMMTSLLGVSMRSAIATGSGILLFISVVAFVGKFQAGQIQFPLVIILTLGAMAGGHLGARLSRKIPTQVLKGMYISVMTLALVRVVWEFFK